MADHPKVTVRQTAELEWGFDDYSLTDLLRDLKDDPTAYFADMLRLGEAYGVELRPLKVTVEVNGHHAQLLPEWVDAGPLRAEALPSRFEDACAQFLINMVVGGYRIVGPDGVDLTAAIALQSAASEIRRG